MARYVEAAQAAGLERGDPEAKLTDELLGEVIDAIRPGRPPGDHCNSWETLREHEDFIKERLKRKLTLVKIHNQLRRHTGIVLPPRSFSTSSPQV